jgi:hypothetical protein
MVFVFFGTPCRTSLVNLDKRKLFVHWKLRSSLIKYIFKYIFSNSLRNIGSIVKNSRPTLVSLIIWKRERQKTCHHCYKSWWLRFSTFTEQMLFVAGTSKYWLLALIWAGIVKALALLKVCRQCTTGVPVLKNAEKAKCQQMSIYQCRSVRFLINFTLWFHIYWHICVLR